MRKKIATAFFVENLKPQVMIFFEYLPIFNIGCQQWLVDNFLFCIFLFVNPNTHHLSLSSFVGGATPKD